MTPIYGGMAYERIREVRLQWPCPSKEHPGTPYLHKGKFSRGKGQFFALEFKEPAELPDDEYPLILTTGRIIFHFHSGAMTRRMAALDREASTGYVEINPEDAEKRDIVDGELVLVQSRRGEIKIEALVTRRVPKEVIFISWHFAQCAANILTNPALESVDKIPEYKACAAKVEKITVTSA